MRWLRFLEGERVKYGLESDGVVTPVKGSPFNSYQRETKSYALEDLMLLSPCEPSKVLCVGLNYRDHAQEVKIELPDKPVIFMKPSTSVVGSCQDIVCPPISRRVDYEAELAVVIRKTAKNIARQDAHQFVLGYTCGNDVTARDLQPKDGQWTISKSFDTFCPLGPVIDTDANPDNLMVRLLLNGEVKQQANTNQMIFSPLDLVSYLSAVMTLHPGDVILTGTPSGIGPIRPGDQVTVEIDGIGSLVNPVVEG
ncbi:fumarylacetoacetate hydrolase family protein [Metallumcola ferriviriculae]|uniref:Fumarylacetoacetate hydrolase family protein n=2 Tax=Metallumcola ferriviriculae TaxID=3039180 RepID=A0AAU0UUN3_9FIRM|nr:fumarylacetoacetate hydrolase family protein [Desulfitibacteraceae bacterium MK1]